MTKELLKTGLKSHCRGLFLALIMVVEARYHFASVSNKVYSFKGLMPKGNATAPFSF